MLIRRLLAPIDFSPRSTAALRYAFELAALIGAEVDVLHVVPGPGEMRSRIDGYLGLPMPHASPQAVQEAREQLQRVVETTPHGNVKARLTVETGDAATAIVRVAAETPVDMIVMSTRGHRGMVELVLGSVAHKVITCARCPVVTLSDQPR
jgi:nucleotide-binding universal stress UspA family protein